MCQMSPNASLQVASDILDSGGTPNLEWAMLGSNQRHLPYESSVMVC
jgi:hypothetical protein